MVDLSTSFQNPSNINNTTRRQATYIRLKQLRYSQRGQKEFALSCHVFLFGEAYLLLKARQYCVKFHEY
jgi:hypothetical protein